MSMGTIPRGIHSYQELRKRWMVSVLILGGVSAGAAYLLTASWFIAAVCFLIGQMISFADFFRLRKATDIWIEEMLSDLHIDVDDLGSQTYTSICDATMGIADEKRTIESVDDTRKR